MKNKKIYVLYVPDQVDRRTTYELNLNGTTLVKIYHLLPGANDMKTEIVAVNGGKLKLKVTETPFFLEMIK